MPMTNAKKSYKNFVCPYCFNTLDGCTCESHLPHYLIWIDSGIQEHIRILNQKGYRTKESCESHNRHMNMYISFAYDYGFGDTLPVPNGFRLKRDNTVSLIYNKNITDDEFEVQKQRHLDSLLEWCRDLPRYNDN